MLLFQDESPLYRSIYCYTAHICSKCNLHAAVLCVCAEKDKERTQRHHDDLVIAINAGKDELREKRKERGAAADANRKAGLAPVNTVSQLLSLVFHMSCISISTYRLSMPDFLQFANSSTVLRYSEPCICTRAV